MSKHDQHPPITGADTTLPKAPLNIGIPPETETMPVPTSLVPAAAGTALQVYDFGEDAGAGMEGITGDEYRIPFFRILDPKSPQCAPVKAGGLGAAPGSIFNTATGAIYDGDIGVEFVPCARDHNFTEWIKRNESGGGGGFVLARAADDPIVAKLREEQGRFKKLQVPNTDHEIAEGFYLYSLMLPPDGDEIRGIVGFTGMQIKKYQSFINRYDGMKYQTARGLVKPPLWAHRWHLQTVYESRGDQSWYGWKISLAQKKADGVTEDDRAKSLLPMDSPLYLAGREFYKLVTEGRVKADFAGGGAAEGGETGGAAADGRSNPNEEIPF